MTPAHEPINQIPLKSGLILLVCQYCGRTSSPRHNRSDLPAGWWVTPQLADVVHPDGSRGTTFKCPECAARSAAGDSLMPRSEPKVAR